MPHTRPLTGTLTALALVLCAIPRGPAGEKAGESKPRNDGPVKLLTASWLGGSGDDELVAAAYAPDGTLLLAGNTVDLAFAGIKAHVLGPAGTLDANAVDPKKKGQKWVHPSTHGFLVRLTADGRKMLEAVRFGYGMATIRKLRLDEKGDVYVLGRATKDLDLGGGLTAAAGTFVVALTLDGADGVRVRHLISQPDILDFGVDGNGEVVVLTKPHLTRYTADGKTKKWSVTWKAHGDNRPGAMTVSPDTGVTAVVGYGMTHTGKEPYKDPYAYGFDREGKQLWALWNPDPAKEKDAKWSTPDFKTNGLMADTTGHAAAFGADGKIYFMLYADGGNTVCMRDPSDVDRPLDKNVLAGVFQPGPGHGFKGASRTSVIFRLDARKGTLEKGTWMCAWISPQRANGLGMDAAASDARGRQLVVGNSASGCPTKDPWYVCKEGGYQGGGYLAVFDADFKMLQCGYFPGASISAVSACGGYIAIAGSARHYEDEASKTAARTYQPLQGTFGGGGTDGYFAVFQVGE